MGKFGSSKSDKPITDLRVGDRVRFDSSQSEVYSYEVPETNRTGIVQLLSMNFALYQLLGVELEMALVRFEDESEKDQMERMIYIEHLRLISRGNGEILEVSSTQDHYDNSNIN